MNSHKQAILETDDLTQAGQTILSFLKIAGTDGRCIGATHTERANYKAVKNWLMKYQPEGKTTSLEQIQGFLESFYHLCAVDAWEQATELLLLRLNVVNTELQGSLIDPLHLQLGRWGYYIVQIQLYKQLSGRCPLDAEMVCLNGLGLAYQNLGNYPEAIEYHSRHLAIAKQIENTEAQQNALCNLGNVYGAVGQYPTANTFYQQALNLAHQLDDRRGEGKLLGNLGVLQRLQGNFEEAIAYHQQHLHLAIALDDQDGQANALENLGVAHYYLGIHDIASAASQLDFRVGRVREDRSPYFPPLRTGLDSSPIIRLKPSCCSELRFM